MKLANDFLRIRYFRLFTCTIVLSILCSSVNFVSAQTAFGADNKKKTNPAGTTVNGDTIKNKDLTACKNKAKTNVETVAKKACEDFCSPAKVKHYGSGDASEPPDVAPDSSGKYSCTSSIAVTACDCHPVHGIFEVRDEPILLFD